MSHTGGIFTRVPRMVSVATVRGAKMRHQYLLEDEKRSSFSQRAGLFPSTGFVTSPSSQLAGRFQTTGNPWIKPIGI